MTITKLATLLIIATIAGMLAGAWGALELSDRLGARLGQIPEPNGLLHVSGGTWRWWDTEPAAGVSGKCWLGPESAWHDASGVKMPPLITQSSNDSGDSG